MEPQAEGEADGQSCTEMPKPTCKLPPIDALFTTLASVKNTRPHGLVSKYNKLVALPPKVRNRCNLIEATQPGPFSIPQTQDQSTLDEPK